MFPRPIQTLYEQSHRLFHLGEDGAPLYADDLSTLTAEVDRLSSSMLGYTAVTQEDEACLCLSLLMSFAGTYTRNPEKESRLSEILDRVYALLSGTTLRWPGVPYPDSLLRAQLTVFTYSFTYDDDLLTEATRLLSTWEGRDLTKEEVELLDLYTTIKT